MTWSLIHITWSLTTTRKKCDFKYVWEIMSSQETSAIPNVLNCCTREAYIKAGVLIQKKKKMYHIKQVRTWWHDPSYIFGIALLSCGCASPCICGDFFFWDFQLDYDASSPGVSVLNYALRKHELRVRCKRIMCSAKLWFLDTLCKNKSCVLNILLCVTLNYFSTLYNKQKRTPYTQLIFWQSVLWTHVLNTHGVVLGKVLRALATVFCV